MRVPLSIHISYTRLFIPATFCALATSQVHAQQTPADPQAVQTHPFTPIPSLSVQQVQQAAPLTRRQKFDLFGAFTLDPTTYIVTGIFAGVEQAGNYYSDFGQGARGYGRRYGTAYADFFTSNFLGEALLPAMFKQDPRYFYKGEGTLHARALYAVSYSVIGWGDNHERQINYSRLLGDLASGGISNLYYPASSRNGVSLTFFNFGFGIASQAATNLAQEFFFHKTTGSK